MTRCRIATVRMAAMFAVVVLGAQCRPGGAGQLSTGIEVPEALKHIRPASSVCRKDEAAPAGSVQAPGLAIEPDYACAIDAGAVPTSREQNSVLVDVRPAFEFDVFHIEGSVNASAAELHGKPYWRGKDVVLVGNGKAERQIYLECARLKRLGYQKVSVLRGGIPAWLAAGLPVAGLSPSLRQLTRLNVSEVMVETMDRSNLVILGKGQDALQTRIPFAVTIPEATAAAVRAVVSHRRKAMKNAPLASVILVPDSGMSEEQIERIQRAVQPVSLLVYTDTQDAFHMQLATQQAVWGAHARGPTMPACGR